MNRKIFTWIKRTGAGILLFAFMVSGLTGCQGKENQDNDITPSPKVQRNQDNDITPSPKVKEEEESFGYEVRGDVLYVSGKRGFGYGFGHDSGETGANGVVLWYVDGQDAEKMFIEKNVQLKWDEDDLCAEVSNYSSNVAGCPFVSEISVDEGNKMMYAKDGILYLYGYDSHHKEKGLYACPMAKKGRIKIPEGEKVIWSCAFNGCSEVTSVYIPKSIQGIGDAAFGDMISCKSIEVSEENRYYKSINGVLYTKDGKVLLAYPSGRRQKKFQVPQGVKYIASGAFMKADYLETVVLPESVNYVYESAFLSCDNMRRAVLKGDIENLAHYSFYRTAIKNRDELPEYSEFYVDWRKKYHYFDLNSKYWITGYRGLGR